MCQGGVGYTAETMASLETQYLGLQLKNPFVVSSSSLTQSLEGIKRAASAGAAAVVLKSLFEEQIESDISDDVHGAEEFQHPEAVEYVRQMGMRLGPTDYISLVEDAKRSVDIPVIASINCVSTKWWGSFATQIAEAGADALELNVSLMPTDPGLGGEAVERAFVRIVDKVRRTVDLPLAVKIGPHFSALPAVAAELRKAGAKALVLFNRFYRFDIDLEKHQLKAANQFSSPEEMHLPLRWISTLYDQVGCELCASTGVHDSDGAAKLLLAGAQAIQVCSVLYKNGYDQLQVLIEGLNAWMDKHGHKSLGDIRGKLSRARSEQPEVYERLQYIKALTGIS